jgi:CheY-like chemotaxis protein
MPKLCDKTILIADDDHELVHALSLRCRGLGLRVLAAYDAFSVLSLAKTATPDVICLDVNMPAGNGLGVCEMLASDAVCRSIPVLVVTGQSDPDTIVRCHNMCVYYVEKNVDVWCRIEPLLWELLGKEDGVISNGAPPVDDAVVRPSTGGSRDFTDNPSLSQTIG